MPINKEGTIKLIAAVSDNGVIGLENGELPWVLPGDLKHFKGLTTNNTIVMGYKTWKSLGELALPNRMNIVISRKKRPLPRKRNVRQIHNPYQIRALPKGWQQGDIYIIGGGIVYNSFLPLVHEMIITNVHVTIPDTGKCIKFPNVDLSEWTENKSKSESHEENGIKYEVKYYVRTTIS